MISPVEAAKQVRRLGAMRSFPRQPEAVEELIRALCKVAKDLEHAEKIIDQAIESGPICPTPYDLLEMGGHFLPEYWRCK